MHEVEKPEKRMEPTLTAREQYQLYDLVRMRPEAAHFEIERQTISRSFVRNPEHYAAYFSDPFSSHAEMYLEASDAIPFDPEDLRFIAVLAEPEGAYEKRFATLTRSEKRDALYEQIDSTAQMAARMEIYVSENQDRVWDMNQSALYRELSENVFGTTDQLEIAELYAKSQRKGLRLAILSFITDLARIKQYKDAFQGKDREFVTETLKFQPSRKPSVEFLPIGVAITLHPSDFLRLYRDFGMDGENTRGCHITAFPNNTVNGRLVLIKGDEAEKEAQVKKHEVSHVVYANYYRSEHIQTMEYDESRHAPDRMPVMLAEAFARNFHEFEGDELIAYVFSGSDVESLNGRGGKRWNQAMQIFESEPKLHDMTKPLWDRQKQFIKNTGKRVWIAKQLYETSNGSDTTISEEKAKALLSVTPTTKWRRLAGYLHMTPRELDQYFDAYVNDVASQFHTAVEAVTTPRRFDRIRRLITWRERPKHWYKESYPAWRPIYEYYPNASATDLLKALEHNPPDEYFRFITVDALSNIRSCSDDPAEIARIDIALDKHFSKSRRIWPTKKPRKNRGF